MTGKSYIFTLLKKGVEVAVIKPGSKEISLCFSPPAVSAGSQPTIIEELARVERTISDLSTCVIWYPESNSLRDSNPHGILILVGGEIGLQS